MNVELSVTSARAKARAIAQLHRLGYNAETGSVRLAYPFSILVEDLAEADVEDVRRQVAQVDPCAGTIVV